MSEASSRQHLTDAVEKLSSLACHPTPDLPGAARGARKGRRPAVRTACVVKLRRAAERSGASGRVLKRQFVTICLRWRSLAAQTNASVVSFDRLPAFNYGRRAAGTSHRGIAGLRGFPGARHVH